MTKINPVVGYTGGKRRLLPYLRPELPVESINWFVEPFVGMGAVYLDLRVRGYKGPATLADNNDSVQAFWSMVHDTRGKELVEASKELESWPATEDGFWQMMSDAADDKIVRTARFLWLTNFMYANLPPAYDTQSKQWVAPRSSGTKLKSAAKWGKTFPWKPCVERIAAVCKILDGQSCFVKSDGVSLLASMRGFETVYADPPYLAKARYETGGQKEKFDYITPVFQCAGRHVLLTETADVTPPAGWSKTSLSVLNRQAGPGHGAGVVRTEFLYSKKIR